MAPRHSFWGGTKVDNHIDTITRESVCHTGSVMVLLFRHVLVEIEFGCHSCSHKMGVQQKTCYPMRSKVQVVVRQRDSFRKGTLDNKRTTCLIHESITPSTRRLLKRRIGSIPRFVGRHLQWRISFRTRQTKVIPNPHPTRCSSAAQPLQAEYNSSA